MSRLKAIAPKTAELSKPKVLIFGAPGVGKTWFSLDWPSVYFIDTEGGARRSQYIEKLERSGGAYFGPDQGSRAMAEITNQLKALAVERHPFKTTVIDSVSQPYKDLITETAERLGDKDAYGASKKPAMQQIRHMAMWADRLDMSVIFVAHERDVWGANGKTGVTFDCDPGLAYRLDLCIHVFQTGASRRGRVIKTRLEGFPPNDSFEWNFAEFAARYGREAIEQEVKPIMLATPEQVAEMKALVSAVRVSDDILESWKNKAGVSEWEDFSADDLLKCIALLKGKLQ